MEKFNCQNDPCVQEDCLCKILEGPITIQIEGSTTLELETPCLNKIKELGLTEEQFSKVKIVLDYLSKLKMSQTKALSKEDQIQALRDMINLFDNVKVQKDN